MARVLIILAAVVGTAVVAAPAGAQEHVFVPRNCETNAYKPKSITVSCADSNFRVTKIKWSSYGTSSANGSATARVNDCNPDCAGGTFRSYPATVRLTRVRQCGDVPQFKRIAVTFTGKRPKGMAKTETERFACADAPGY
jgi:hypothetical protein